MTSREYRGQRTRPRVEILKGEELAEAFDCGIDELEEQLKRRSILYHKDTVGRIYASLPTSDYSGQYVTLDQQDSDQEHTNNQ